jgi:glycosyltransferase involved in cell wall biosynthesis
LRIAQVAPLYESVPPQLYGGTERVVSWLTEELVRQGHDVTLFASGDSATTARLVAPVPNALRLDPGCVDQLALHMLLLEEVFRRQGDFDVVHFHCDYLHFPFSRRQRQAHVTTLHGRLDLPELPRIYREYGAEPVVSISQAQQGPLPWLNWHGVVHHGLPRGLHTFREGPGRYLAFLGRISPEKRVDRAVEIARRVGLPLRIAAKVDRADRDYFTDHIEPLLQRSAAFVEFVGEVGGSAKDEFLGDAIALLFPIDWPEPFGLVMIEAMACGTPVIAWPCGSVPEVIEDGVTGFVVNDVEEAVSAVERVGELSRRRCRETFERRFADERMARDYLAIYRGLTARRGAGNGHARRRKPRIAPVDALRDGDGQIAAPRRAPRLEKDRST